MHTLKSISSNQAFFKCLGSIVDLSHPFIATVYPPSDGLTHPVTKLKSSQKDFMNMTMSCHCSTEMGFTVTIAVQQSTFKNFYSGLYRIGFSNGIFIMYMEANERVAAM